MYIDTQFSYLSSSSIFYHHPSYLSILDITYIYITPLSAACHRYRHSLLLPDDFYYFPLVRHFLIFHLYCNLSVFFFFFFFFFPSASTSCHHSLLLPAIFHLLALYYFSRHHSCKLPSYSVLSLFTLVNTSHFFTFQHLRHVRPFSYHQPPSFAIILCHFLSFSIQWHHSTSLVITLVTSHRTSSLPA